MFLASVMRGEILRNSGLKLKEQKKQESKSEQSDGIEESKGGPERYSVRGDRHLVEQKQEKENTPIGEGSSLKTNRVDA